MEELKPCPVCGHAPEHPRDFFDCDGENVFYVGCDNEECPADIGIIHDDVEEAAHIWNSLPRPLRWTKEHPTEPGYYWFRNEEVEGILQICKSVKGLYIMYHGNDEEWDLPEGEWAGPIQEPVE